MVMMAAPAAARVLFLFVTAAIPLLFALPLAAAALFFIFAHSASLLLLFWKLKSSCNILVSRYYIVQFPKVYPPSFPFRREELRRLDLFSPQKGGTDGK